MLLGASPVENKKILSPALAFLGMVNKFFGRWKLVESENFEEFMKVSS